MMDEIQKRLLAEVADLHGVPEGAYNIRANGQMAARNTTANIDIVSKTDVSGIDIYIKPGTVNESVHIPVVLSQSGMKEMVYNDFHIGEGSDVVIVAGCGIDNCGDQDAEHDGIHRFFIEKNAKVKYVEKHYGAGDGKGKRILNPGTEVYMEEGSYMEMEMVQIKGVDSTERDTKAELAAGAKLVVRERLMTHGDQHAVSGYSVSLNGEGASAMSFHVPWQKIPPIRNLIPGSSEMHHAAVIPSVMPLLWTKHGSLRFRSWRPMIWTQR